MNVITYIKLMTPLAIFCSFINVKIQNFKKNSRNTDYVRGNMNNKKRFIIIFLVLACLISSISCKITPKYGSSENEIVFVTRPTKVANLTAPNVVTTDDGVNVSWQYQDDADGYILYCQSADDYAAGVDIDDKILTSLKKDQNWYTIKNLKEAGRYVIGVKSYKTTYGKTLYSEMSDLVEFATRPTLKIKTTINTKEQNVEIEFATSNRKSVLSPGKDIYIPEYIVYSSLHKDEIFKTYMNTINNGIIKDEQSEIEAPKANIINKEVQASLNTGLQYAFTTRDSRLVTDTIASNTSVDFSVSMSVNKEEISHSGQIETIDNPPNKYPAPVKEVSVINNLKDRIEITWQASELNGGIEQESIVGGVTQTVEQVFKIVRIDLEDNSKTVVLDFSDKDRQPSDSGNLVYTFVDTDVEVNKTYVYSVLPYYVFTKNGTNTTNYPGSKEELSQKAYILPSPQNITKSWIVKNPASEGNDRYKEYKNPDNPLEATYTARISWKLPQINQEDMSYVFKITSTDPSGRISTLLPDGTDMQTLNEQLEILKDGETYYTEIPITLTPEQDKDLWKFSFTMSLYNRQGDTQGEQNSEGDPLESIPSIRQIEFIKQSNASFSDISENAASATLKWNVISEEELSQADSSLLLDNLVFDLYRGETPDNLSYQCFTNKAYGALVQNGEVSETNLLSYYDHSDLEDGKTYYYLLTCRYEDENSIYHNRSGNIRFDGVRTMNPVKNITASYAASEEFIEVSFTRPEGAENFRIQYKLNSSVLDSWTDLNTETDIMSSDDIASGTFHFIKNAHTSNAGEEYLFRVYAMDKNGNSVITYAETQTPGSLFGIKGFDVNATANEYADKIVVSWNKVNGATSYAVYVYEDAGLTKEIFNETVSESDTSYVMDVSSIENYPFTDGQGYPLSRPYYFKVSPLKGAYKAGLDAKDNFSLPSAEGKWLFPPRNIKASKSDSRFTINLSWDRVEGAEGYEIYRKEAGKDDAFEYISYKPQSETNYFEDLTASISKEYEYTVSSVLGNTTSIKQNYSLNSTDRIGCLLSVPTKITTSEETDSLFSITFCPSLGVEGYEINTTSSSYTITSEQINSAPSSLSSASENSIITKKNTNGDITSVTFYLKKPVIVSNPLVTVNINAYKNVSDEKRTSSTYSIGQKTSVLKANEIVNLVNTTLTQIIYDFNLKANGDWWGNSFKDSVNPTFRDGDKNGVYYIQGETSNWIGGCNNDGHLQLKKYYDNNTLIEMTTTTNIRLVSKNGDSLSAGYLGTDPLDYIGGGNTGVMQITLPYDMGTATIQYNSVKADGSNSGTYVVTYKNTTTTVTPAEVHESVRRFI